MSVLDPRQPLRAFGPKMLEDGYKIIPIKPYSKQPAISKWQKKDSTLEDIKGWASNGRGNCGIGINTAYTPLVDLDIYDDDVVMAMMEAIKDKYGYSVVRVGMSPKMGLLYRTDKPFKKISSPVYVDQDGIKHKVEILGEGQQCVMIGYHPDTKKPYRYPSKADVSNTKVEDLITLTEEDARDIVEMFAEFVPLSWTPENGVLPASNSNSSQDDDDDDNLDFLEAYKPPCDKTVDEIKAYMAELDPDSDGYDGWNRAGMALWHQFHGSDEGFEIWHNWSMEGEAYERTSRRQMKSKWKSFDWTGKRNQKIITFATIIKQVDQGIIDGIAPDTMSAYLERFVYMANDRIVDLNTHIRAQKDIGGGLSIGAIRSLNVEDYYYPVGKKVRKHFIDKWLNNGSKKVAVGFNYSIGEELLFENEGAIWINGYVPPSFATTDREDLINVFHEHMYYLFPNEQDRHLMYQWIAHRVQEPENRIKFVPLHMSIQHGTGRGWLADIITEMVGASNLQTAKMKEISGEGQGAFNTFLDSAVCVLHEVRESGKRFEVSDKVRDTLDADYLKVTYKGKTAVMKQISCSFLMFSNHLDALAIDQYDRRIWAILGPDHLKPTSYYDNLYSYLDRKNPQRSEFLMQLYNFFKRYDISTFKRGQVAPDFSGARAKLVANAANGNDFAMDVYMRTKPFAAATTNQIVEWCNLEFPDEELDKRIIAKLIGNSMLAQRERMRFRNNTNCRPWIESVNHDKSNIWVRKELEKTEAILERLRSKEFESYEDLNVDDLI